MRRGIFLFFFPLLFSSCSDGLNNPSAYSVIPSIDFDCDQDEVSQCSSAASNNKLFYLGLHTSSDDCDSILASLVATPFRLGFDAHGQGVVSHVGFSATGNLGSWNNSNSIPIQYIENGTYNVCGFIDINENGRVDSLEPVGTGTLSTSVDPNPTINSWTAH